MQIISKKQIADWEGLDDLCLDFETNVKKSIYIGNPFLSLNILEQLVNLDGNTVSSLNC